MNMSDGAAMAIMVLAMASCTAATGYYGHQTTVARANADPRTACVAAAWTQADRIECIKATPSK